MMTARRQLRWIDPAPVDVPADLLVAAGSPRVAEIMVRRGIQDPQAAQAFLDPSCYTPADPSQLPDLDIAAGRLAQAIRAGEPVCVWGDFDVDGQCATAILVSALAGLGADARFYVPVRATESHGVNLPGLEKVINAGARLVLTCDTGIGAHDAVEYARSRGVEMLITDHHELGETLPPALAVVDPRRLPEGHPLSGLPGAGVALLLAQEICRRAGRLELSEPLLELAALAIVADVAEQRGDTRYLLQRGLAALRQTSRPALQALYTVANLTAARLTEAHIGFALGPRLNALGRLADANEGVAFLLTTDPGQARLVAEKLEGLNARRKLLTSQIYNAALAQIDRDPALLNESVLVLAHPEWSGGVVGIVASRLVETFGRPAILLVAPPGEMARGSARSVDGINITAAIASQSGLLNGFGGHPMAAGLSLEPQHIPAFRRGVSQFVRESLGGGELPQAVLPLDGELPLAEVDLALARDLERLAPFGAGNPELVFAARGLTLRGENVIGRDGEDLRVEVEDEQGRVFAVLWWGGAGQPLPQGKFDLAYSLRSTSFRGQEQVTFTWIDALAARGVTEVTAAPALETIDCRREPDPLGRLEALRRALGAGLQVWCEGPARQDTAGVTRSALEPRDALVIWSAPPDQRTLDTAIRRAAPRLVYLFADDPGLDEARALLTRLAALAKYAIQERGGQAALSELAAACAQTPLAVQAALAVMGCKGILRADTGDDGIVSFSAAGGPDAEGLPRALDLLNAVLAENRAYRAYARRASPEHLIRA